MGHEDHLGPQHRRDPDVLGQVVVVADQETGLDAPDVDDVIRIAGSQCRVDERVQLAKPGDEPLRTDGRVTVVERPRGVRLHETGHHDGIIPTRDRLEGADRRAVGDRLGHGGELGAVQVLEEGVTADRALVEADDLGPLLDRPTGQGVDPGEVVRLVVVAMLELGGGDRMSRMEALPSSKRGPDEGSGCIPISARGTEFIPFLGGFA